MGSRRHRYGGAVRQDAGVAVPAHQGVTAPGPGAHGVAQPGTVLGIQRSAGNRALTTLLDSGRVRVQRKGGRSASELLAELEGDDDRDDLDDDLDEDGSRDRPGGPATVWDFAPQTVKDEAHAAELEKTIASRRQEQTRKDLADLTGTGSVTRTAATLTTAQAHGHFGTAKDEKYFLDGRRKARERERDKLSTTSPVAKAKEGLAQEQQAKAEAARLERQRQEDLQRQAEEEARRLAEEQQAKEKQEKQEIGARLKKDLTDAGWNRIPGQRRTELVEQAWNASRVSPEEAKSFIARRKKQVNGKNAEERQRKAEAALPRYREERLDEAVAAVRAVAQKIIDSAVLEEKKADLAADKVLLRQAIAARNPSAEVVELLGRALDAITVSTGTDASVDKGYQKTVVMEACRHWKALPNARIRGAELMSQLRAVTALWSPGEWNHVEWKERGQNWERTKNLMATVHGHTVNVHVHPNPWTWPKNRPNRPD